MQEVLGIILALISIALTARWVTSEKPHKLWALTICLVAVFFCTFLILQEKVTEISVKGVGTIKAAVEQATSDAKAIAHIKERIESQRVKVDFVAQQATTAKELSESLSNKDKQIESKLVTLDYTIDNANKKLRKMESLTEYTKTVIAAQSDDRESFDKLKAWADDSTYPFAAEAVQAWAKIIDEHASPMYRSGMIVPWKEGVDPSTLTIQDVRRTYQAVPVYLKPALIEFAWKKNDIPKRERMEFLIDVLKTDRSLKAVEYASRYFASAANLKIKPLAVEHLVKWWEENKDKLSKRLV